MKMEIISNDKTQTMNFGATIAKTCQRGQVISLVGDLGAGKTTFAQGFAKGLGIEENVTSPTFTILNEYTTGRLPLFHFDMYRIENSEEISELGFEEYFDSTLLKGVVLVEWAEKVPELMPKKYLKITFHRIDDQKRKIVVEGVAN